MASLAARDAGAVTWFRVSQLPMFSDVQAQLQILVDANGHKNSNKFCVVGQRAGRDVQAYVYWPAENKLILWIPIQGNPQAIVDSKRYLDLTRDIVKHEANNSSTYMMTRAEANEIIHGCHRHGTAFVIEKSGAAPHG